MDYRHGSSLMDAVPCVNIAYLINFLKKKKKRGEKEREREIKGCYVLLNDTRIIKCLKPRIIKSYVNRCLRFGICARIAARKLAGPRWRDIEGRTPTSPPVFTRGFAKRDSLYRHAAVREELLDRRRIAIARARRFH